MKKNKLKNAVVVYQAPSGAVEVRMDEKKETVILTQQQVGELFDVQKAAISKHVKNIFDTGELDKKSTVSIMETVQIEGGRRIKRKIEYYNLDLILSIGYRVNSANATKFRQWATKTLREYITKGYAINRKQVAKHYDTFMRSVGDIQALLPEHIALDPRAVLDLVKEFSSTWMSLDAYDKNALVAIGTTKKAVTLSGNELADAIAHFRQELLRKGEVLEHFAHERTAGSVAGIVGNVMQSFGGKPLYASMEEKAAHLLYFMVKDHPFIDGNKRSGAFAFVWFLRKAKVRTLRNINPGALTALTLLVAESAPQKKDQMIALITQILR